MIDSIISFCNSLLGLGDENFNTLHIVSRSLLIYLIGIGLVRLGNKRFASKMSAFDIILAIIIGSLLSRAVTEKDLFLEIIAACFALVFLHRTFSFIAARSHQFGLIIKGNERVIVKDGKILWDIMKKSNLSENDLMQALRLNLHIEELKQVKTARIERDGNISFTQKDN